MKNRKPINPFYVLLLLAGVAFGITACAYGVMTVRQFQSAPVAGYQFFEEDSNEPPADFNEVLDRYGFTIMIWELALLAVGTFGAIAYDQHLDKKAESQGESS